MATGGRIAMNTGTPPMTMHTDSRLLVLTQWLSPAYPLGSFAFSHGLEAACARGWVQDAAGLQDWLQGVIEAGSGRADAIWIELAWSASRPVAELDALARAYAPSAERLRETVKQGEAFAAISSQVWDIDVPKSPLPVALGHAALQVALDVTVCKALYLQSFTSNLVASAQRLMPLGQTAAQRIVANLSPLCMTVAEDTAGAALEDVVSNAFLSDVAAMAHESLDVRVFQT